MDLVYDQWWTDVTGTTDSSGAYATSAFLGDYEISVNTNSGSATTMTAITDASSTTTVTITINDARTGDNSSND